MLKVLGSIFIKLTISDSSSSDISPSSFSTSFISTSLVLASVLESGNPFLKTSLETRLILGAGQEPGNVPGHGGPSEAAAECTSVIAENQERRWLCDAFPRQQVAACATAAEEAESHRGEEASCC